MISDQAHEKLKRFTSHLLDVNRRINLISRQRSAEVAEDLIADSLAILPLIGYPPSAKVLDIGSGAGFPWIVHKVVRPDLEIISVDSNRRKIAFQRDVARILGFQQCSFHAARIEAVPELDADLCIAKALGSVEIICRLVRRHLREEGRLVLPRSADEAANVGAVETLGFELESAARYEAAGRTASLLLLRKR